MSRELLDATLESCLGFLQQGVGVASMNWAKLSLPAAFLEKDGFPGLARFGVLVDLRTRSDWCLRYRPRARQASRLDGWSGFFSMTARISLSTDGDTALPKPKAA